MADCCHPIPGDDVLGYLDESNNIVIHKRQCPIAAKLKTSDGNHILATKWDTHKTMFFPVTIHIRGIDHVGILTKVTQLLSEQLHLNISHIEMTCKDGIFDGELEFGVHDVEDLKMICNTLKQFEAIEEVNRIS